MSATPWDADLLARIERLHLRARRAVEGWRHGGHRSRRVSTNIEFVDHKEYAPGDPIRHLDWKVAARSDRLVIRRHQAETVVPVTLLVDVSADIGTGEGRPDVARSKFEAVITMAATVAVFLSDRGDPVGLEMVGGSGSFDRTIPPRPRSLPAVIRALASAEPAGVAELATAFERLGQRLPRRSVLIAFSDLMEEPTAWGPALGALAARGVDCRVVHVHDPAEWALDYSGALMLFGPEGAEAVPVDPNDARQAMKGVVEGYLEEVRHQLGRHRCRHHLTPIDAGLDRVLASVLEGRS